MIITKTPFRISFFGGGTDYPEYFEKHGGAVLATAIDHSAFISVSRFYSQLFDYTLRVAYRQVECVREVDEIQHPGFRECLRYCGVMRDVEVNYIRARSESERLVDGHEPCIIVASGGMCDGGRIVKHLRRHVEESSGLLGRNRGQSIVLPGIIIKAAG